MQGLIQGGWEGRHGLMDGFSKGVCEAYVRFRMIK